VHCRKCREKINAQRLMSGSVQRSYRKSYQSLRDETFAAYGGYQCHCPGCHITEPKFLCIDHVYNDGAQHRRRLCKGDVRRARTLGGHVFYRWLKKNGYPKGFQPLCANCNYGKRMNHGVCPRTGQLH
jgi:hypothetical protein